jgi:hypothetical protein
MNANVAEMVSWQDYDGVEGFGSTSQQEIDDLNKALTVGQERDPPASVVAGDGFALRVESLDRTLRNVIYRAEHLRLFKQMPKVAAYNTVEEYNQIQGYGQNDDAAWIAEGDLPVETDSQYERKFAVTKYLGTTRVVSHVATLIKPAHGPVIAQETVNGTMHLLKVLERALFYGDSSLSDLQFDGYEKLITDDSPAANIIDLRGLPLNEDILTDGALTIFDAPNYGTPTHLHINPRVKSDLVKAFFPKERYDLFQKTGGGMVGLDIRGFTSPAGDVLFEPNVFITDGGGPTAAIGSASLRPGTPTVSTGNTTPADGASQFGADDVGDYFYEIQAVNRYGRSASVLLVAGPTAVTVAEGDKVTWGMTPAGVEPDWYEVFRSKKDGAAGSERRILRVPNAAGAGEQTIDDYNVNLPYTTSGFIFQQNAEAMTFRQLAPMVRIPLATIATSVRWAQVIYGVPVLHTPGKAVLIRNIGRAVGSVGTP